MRSRQRMAQVALTLGALLLLGACGESYENGLEPKPNGAPGKNLAQVYLRDFRVSEAKYFSALDEFYGFAVSQRAIIQGGECFKDVLRLTAQREMSSCIVLYSTMGAPTKVHMTFEVVDRVITGSPHSGIFAYRVGIYVKANYTPAMQVAPAFVQNVETKLVDLDREVAQPSPKRE